MVWNGARQEMFCNRPIEHPSRTPKLNRNPWHLVIHFEWNSLMRASRFLLFCSVLLLAHVLQASQVPVRYPEGLSRGFLILRAQDGKQIGVGESSQTVKRGRVTEHVIFRLKDGSIYEETSVFTQRRTFRLLSDHVLQKGPTFKMQMESSIDAVTGHVVVHYSEGGKSKTLDQKVDLPDDVANGLISTIVKDILPDAVTEVSYLTLSPKPRLAKVTLTREGKDKFFGGGAAYEAVHYVMKMKVTGAVGVLASALGKQPPDTQLWVFPGEAPAFAASEGPLAADAPIWRVELVSPAPSEKSESGTR